MNSSRLAETFTSLVADLDAIGVSWALVGGLAVAARSEPRTTRDIAVAIAVADDSAAETTVRNLRARGYVDEEPTVQEAVDRLARIRFSRKAEQDAVFCDLFFAMSGIEREVVEAAERVKVMESLWAPVATTGHLLALKVLALRPDRPQERSQDFGDIRELLRVADEDELKRARDAVELISRRGFDRGKDLEAVFGEQLRQFEQQQGGDRP